MKYYLAYVGVMYLFSLTGVFMYIAIIYMNESQILVTPIFFLLTIFTFAGAICYLVSVITLHTKYLKTK